MLVALPVILATWEAEIKRTMVQVQSRKKSSQDPISTHSRMCSGAHLSAQPTQEAEIEKIVVSGQPVHKSPK
jgi:hypothetical protein